MSATSKSTDRFNIKQAETLRGELLEGVARLNQIICWRDWDRGVRTLRETAVQVVALAREAKRAPVDLEPVDFLETVGRKREEIMHAVLRTYSGKGAKELFDILEKHAKDIEKLLRSVKGFVSYSLVRTAPGGSSISVCQDKAGTDESLVKGCRRGGGWNLKAA